MTLEEAIENLYFLATAGAPNLTLNDIESIKLGIEALKRLKECQEHHCTLSSIELPGETKE